ncbi:beta-ketoacyl synthase [Ectothiorhodospiraceae bacterium WFHF3C12]|nr:beta-ketoacyl synthase [Ectothiorhodospiraceae bacterium WFHF3C12]
MAAASNQGIASVLGTGMVSHLGTGSQAHVTALASEPPEVSWVGAGELEDGKRLPYRGVAGAPSLPDMMDAAAEQALREAGLVGSRRAGMGLFLGSSSLQIGDCEVAYHEARKKDPDAVPMGGERSGYGVVADVLARRLGLGGPRLTFNTACSSSANAALYAARMIARGELETALILGTESYNRMSLLGFASLMLISDTGARPFDAGRDGLVLGEGVGALVLGRAGAGQAVQFHGGANRCDTSSATNSRPDAIAAVMQSALDEARIPASDVTAIKAHGTSTPSNDEAEGAGMRLTFGDGVPPFTSMKGHLGHTLGACGALETAALVSVLKAGFLPATAGFTEMDSELGIEPLESNRPAGDGFYLLNYFGFGGNNTSLVLRYAS